MIEFIQNWNSIIFGLGAGMVFGNFLRPLSRRLGILPPDTGNWSPAWTGLGLMLMCTAYAALLFHIK